MSALPLRVTPDARAVTLAVVGGRPLQGDSDFAADLLAALTRRPRRIAPKYFYDATGSALFDRICELPEYYPTRTELALLRRHAREMAECLGKDAELVEFGAGSSRKVRVLLDAMERPRRFVPIDISSDHLQTAAERLRADYPTLAVLPIAADFTRRLTLPPALGRRVGFFPGSSIGNFSPDEALTFLRRVATVLDRGLLIGVDLVKDPARLHAAYNDADGVTAAFNLNVLVRANRELGTDFDVAAFSHYAHYDPRLQRVEMHLVSRRAQTVRLRGQAFDFDEGDSLHTENSYKYTVEQFRSLAREAGYRPGAAWVDEERLFSLHWLGLS